MRLLPILPFVSLIASAALAASAAPELVGRVTEVVKTTRDPFRRERKAGPAALNVSDLERYPAEQFRLSGVVSGIGKVKAMLVGPNNKTYFVSENTKIGMRKGVIMLITPDQITVRERVVSPIGDEENVDVIIRLATNQENVGNP